MQPVLSLMDKVLGRWAKSHLGCLPCPSRRLGEPRFEIFLEDIGGTDRPAGVREERPLVRSWVTLSCRLRRNLDGEHTLQLSPGTAGDASEEREEQGWLRYVSADRTGTRILARLGHPTERQLSYTVQGASDEGMRSAEKPHRTVLDIPHDLQLGGEG